MTTVIYHSADFDGLFCREIAKRFLDGPDVHFIGWDFADAPLPIPAEGLIYILDLPVDRVFGFKFDAPPNGETMEEQAISADMVFHMLERLIWIDHHKSSIETHPPDIAGYRIDGVSACRLAWQWFIQGKDGEEGLPDRNHFVDRVVKEPHAVRLAGEYDIWDKRDPNAEIFQFGLRSSILTALDWNILLTPSEPGNDGPALLVASLLTNGRMLQRYQREVDASVVKYRSGFVFFEGLRFLALNTARCNSLTFAALDVPETGHDALMGYYYKDGMWNVSLYNAKHRTDLDLSKIAVKHGGGGHRGACGFRAAQVPWVTNAEPTSPVR